MGLPLWTASVMSINHTLSRSTCIAVSLRIQCTMIEIRQTETYASWFAGLRERQARARIDVRIRRLSLGNLGEVRPVGEGVSELRIDYGPGYRIYFVQRGQQVVILLSGGDKRIQTQDIQAALDLARGL